MVNEYLYRVVDKNGSHVGSGGSALRVFSKPNQATALKNRMNEWSNRVAGYDEPRYRVQRAVPDWEDV